jgi:hypothetical protein
MRRNRNIQFIFSLVFCFFVIKARSQSGIVGDTIFVNAEAEIGVRFPKLLTDFRTAPDNAPYFVKGLNNSLTVIAKDENTATSILLVTEGGRQHKFLLVFKKDIDYNTSLDYDYSTVKKIDQRIKQMAAAKESSPAETPAKPLVAVVEPPAKPLPVNTAKVEIPEKKTAVITASSNNAAEYEALTSTARILLEQKKYKESRDGYLKALSLRPGDLYATYQVEKIEKIIAGEDGNKEKERLNSLYRSYLEKANQAFQKENWAEARIAYEEVLVVKPSDPLAAGRLLSIDEKEKLQKNQQDREREYAVLMQQGEDFYKAEAYEEAKSIYAKAAAVFKRPLPQEKIKEITALQQRLASEEKTAAAAREKKEMNDAVEKARQEKEAQYASLIKTADDYFVAADYTNAAGSYNSAIRIFKRPWPQDQLKEISLRLADLARKEKEEKTLLSAKLEKDRKEAAERKLEEDYQAAVKEADDLFSSGNLEPSKKMYMAALGLIKRPWPQDQIRNIDKKITEQIVAANAEKKRLEKEAAELEKYNKAMAAAELAYKKPDYIKAKKFYRDALAIKAAEAQPAQMISVIEEIEERIKAEEKARRDSIALALETQKKFNVAMAKGKSNVQKKDLDKAKEAFEEALLLKPENSEARVLLENTEKELAEIARINEINVRYDAAVLEGDSLLISKRYEDAYTAFKKALGIKAGEYYPQAQANYIKKEQENIRKTAEREAEMEAKRQLEEKYSTAVKNADNAVSRKDFASAVVYYTEAAGIHPESNYVNSRLKICIHQDNLVKEKIAANMPEEKSGGSKKKNKKAVPAPATAPQVNAGSPTPPASTETVIPEKTSPDKNARYSDEELRQKYPSIDFSKLPPEQPLNKENSGKDITALLNSIYQEKQRINLKTTAGAVQLVCGGITFEEDKVFFKYTVNNNSDADFLTGFMMLTWTKKNTTNVKLYPLYLYPSSLPVVRPGQSATVIYVAKAYKILEDESLKFEMHDRLNKMALQLAIPVKIYYQEMARIPVIGMK